MNFPNNLKYTKDHEWIKDNGDGTATIGITDFAAGELGDIVYIEVDTVGDEVEQNEVFGTVEAVKTTSDLFMPITGEILEFNSELDESEGDNPSLVNEDPYEAGWIVKVSIQETSQMEDLLSAEQYKELVG